VWSALVYGFGGFRDHGGTYRVDPRLPEAWTSLSYRITLHEARVRVTVEREQVTLVLETGELARLTVRGKEVQVTTAEPVVVPLDGQGPRMPGGPPVWGRDGVRRADGTVITASVPRPSDGQDPLAD
jgi:alpha,alpha-trehalose phosphorylase